MSVLCFCAYGFTMFTFSKWWSYLFWFMVKQMHWCRVHNANKHLFVWTTYRWESKLNIGFYLLKYWVKNIAGNIGNWEFLKKPISVSKYVIFRFYFPVFFSIWILIFLDDILYLIEAFLFEEDSFEILKLFQKQKSLQVRPTVNPQIKYDCRIKKVATQVPTYNFD